MNDKALKFLKDDLKRAKIRREISYRVCDEAYTAESILRRRLEEAKRNNEPQEGIDTMNGDLEMASAITTEARLSLKVSPTSKTHTRSTNGERQRNKKNLPL